MRGGALGGGGIGVAVAIAITVTVTITVTVAVAVGAVDEGCGGVVGAVEDYGDWTEGLFVVIFLYLSEH